MWEGSVGKISRGGRYATAITVALATGALVVALPALGAAGKTKLISKTSAGDPADDDSYDPSISASGRYVAFESSATNLPGDDTVDEVYIHDRKTGKTRLVSKTSAGTPADDHSYLPSISASGRYVAFESSATNLPGDDTADDVYIHDRKTGKTRLVSKTSAGAPADGNSFTPSVSATGRYVAFRSAANNLPGNNGVYDVYIHDRKTGNTRLVSKTSAGTPADGNSEAPSISASGRYVAFRSGATNLPGDDTVDEVYIHDRKTGKTRLVSKTSAGTPADDHSYLPSISASGRYVAFDSDATNLPGNDAVNDVYIHDRKSGKTRLVSKTSAGTPADGNSEAPSISASGRYVAFRSGATNLPGDDTVDEVYIHDRKTGKTRLVSKTSAGTPADSYSSDPSVSASGRYVAFESFATNLPGNDAVNDVYIHDRGR